MNASASGALRAHAEGLRHVYPSGRIGLDGVDLSVEPGERVVLLGPNGSGKTTLIRVLSTALRPDGGALHLLDRPVPPATPSLRRRLGVLPDRPAHLEVLTARENALLFARAGGVAGDDTRRRVDALLHRFELSAVADVPVGSFSLGMRRRLALVEALVHEPELLLLDEPSLGLDPSGVDALVGLLEERTAESAGTAGTAGAAVIVALNDPGVAARLATRVVMLDDGRVVVDAPPSRLLAELGGGTRCMVEVEGSREAAAGVLARMEEAGDVIAEGGRDGLQLRLPAGTTGLPAVVTALVEAGVGIRSLRVREADLSDVFRARTGRALDEPVPGRGASPMTALP